MWGPIARPLRQSCGIAPQAPSDEVREKALRASSAPSGSVPESPEVQRVTEGLLHLFGEPSPLDDIEPANARSELTRSVLAFVVGSPTRARSC